VVQDRDFTAALARMFEADLTHARAVTREAN
jgi:hypothetical protein